MLVSGSSRTRLAPTQHAHSKLSVSGSSTAPGPRTTPPGPRTTPTTDPATWLGGGVSLIEERGARLTGEACCRRGECSCGEKESLRGGELGWSGGELGRSGGELGRSGDELGRSGEPLLSTDETVCSDTAVGVVGVASEGVGVAITPSAVGCEGAGGGWRVGLAWRGEVEREVGGERVSEREKAELEPGLMTSGGERGGEVRGSGRTVAAGASLSD